MDLFSREYQDHVLKMRKKFFRSGSVEEITGIRPEILGCWEDAYRKQITLSNAKKKVASPEMFAAARADSAELLAVAEPYMQLLHSFLEPDSFWVGLMDRNHVIVRLVASPTMLGVARSTELVEGSFRGGSGDYPGLYNTCWKLDRPFRIVSGEHPSQIDDGLAGAAAPIHDRSTGEPLGVIGISGYWEKSHGHTMGLTIMAAEAISQQLELRKQNADIAASNQVVNAAFDAMDVGAVYFREDGTVAAANQHAIEMLCNARADRETFVGTNIFGYLGEAATAENIAWVKKTLREEGEFSFELVPTQKYSSLRCTARKIADEQAGYFMQMQKISDLSRTVTDMAFSKPMFSFPDIIGESVLLQSAKDAAQIAAKHSPAVLITGESGTGKEMFAQAIHNSSPRADGPFVAINCGAIPKSLIESELFGYEPGAFTGAQKGGYIGKFELASGGTLFLDEIGDMPYELQVALLRVLQAKEIVRIGGKAPIKIDVRVIAATNQDLEKRIQEKTFRQDLYFRLNILSIRLPSLRERQEDIAPLSLYFLSKYGRAFDKRVSAISQSAQELMKRYSWPGNVRELENTIERAVLVCRGAMIEPQDLPDNLYGNRGRWKSGGFPDAAPAAAPQGERTAEAEELLAVLRQNQGNISEMARQLGVSRPTVYRKLKKCGIDPAEKWFLL